jgi:hypothetical protein
LPIKANSFIRGGIGLRSSPMEQAAQSQDSTYKPKNTYYFNTKEALRLRPPIGPLTAEPMPPRIDSSFINSQVQGFWTKNLIPLAPEKTKIEHNYLLKKKLRLIGQALY